MQKIIVNGYTYVTDQPVKVGDVAVVPTASWLRDVKGDTWQGEVTSLESSYDGHCTKAIAIVPKRKKK